MVRVDVVADIVCPWCFIGHRRLRQALEAAQVEAEVYFHPFLLDPTTPPEGHDLRDHLRHKYGGDVERMFTRVEEAARSSGLPLDFAVVRRMSSTVDAHTLLRHALDRGTQGALAEALFAAYFTEGRDVGARDVLRALATRHEFTVAEVDAILDREDERRATRDEARAMAAQGITGVPFLVFGEQLGVSGAQPVEVLVKAIERVAEA